MISLAHFALLRRVSLSCLAAGAGMLAAVSHGYGQTTVTINSGAQMSLRTGVSTATFSDVNPLANIGTTYTYAPGGTNGSLTLSNLTIGTTATPGSFVSGSSSGQYSTPESTSGTYLAIGGTSRPGPLTVTFSNAANNYFGLEWATPDSYNSVKLTFKDGTSATYTPGTVTGGFNLAASTTNSFVEFTASQPITGVSLSSTSAAFELDNLTFGVVPEPATWVSGGLSLLVGVAALRRQRSRRQA